MEAFIVSFVAGFGFPLLPIFLESLITDGIAPTHMALTAVVYSAAVGLDSRSSAVTFVCLFLATACSAIYGVDLVEKSSYTEYLISAWVIGLSALVYSVERFGRHYYDNEPFLGL